MDVVVKKSKGLIGEIEIPSDKSISHRAILFSLLMKEGTYYIKNFSNILKENNLVRFEDLLEDVRVKFNNEWLNK